MIILSQSCHPIVMTSPALGCQKVAFLDDSEPYMSLACITTCKETDFGMRT
jgi:hypothetical protein